jgi:hypothetical protein
VAEALPQDERDLLREVVDADVTVVRGSYDRVQDVLRLMNIPHRKVDPSAVRDLELDPRHMLIVNCPGEIGVDAVPAVRAFVEAGGTLFTTDWALRHVLERAFPGAVSYNQRPTKDEIARVEIRDPGHPYVAGVLSANADPVWWLEGSSYPIRVEDPSRVEVLVASAELGARHGEPAVVVRFRAGQGEVLHMISHYYLQRAETRTRRHAQDWTAYTDELGAAGLAEKLAAIKDIEKVRLADLEAAHTSMRLMTKLVAMHRRRQRGGQT